MPMNEYGEIVRENNRTNISSNNAAIQSRNNQLTDQSNDHSFSSEVQEQFNVGKKRNFNIITLVIAVPLYGLIGYFAVDYIISLGYDIEMSNSTGAVIGCIASFIATLLYNNIWAIHYEGIEYLISLLFTGIVVAMIALAIVIIGIVVAVIQVILCIIIAIVIIAGLAGG